MRKVTMSVSCTGLFILISFILFTTIETIKYLSYWVNIVREYALRSSFLSNNNQADERSHAFFHSELSENEMKVVL